MLAPAPGARTQRGAIAAGLIFLLFSAHERVVVGARVSKSGQPMPQPGDFEGLSAPVKVCDTGVVIVIANEIR